MKVYELANDLGVGTIEVIDALRSMEVFVEGSFEEVPLGYHLSVARLIIAARDENRKRSTANGTWNGMLTPHDMHGGGF